MRTHTNDFKNEIKKLGRQIKGRIYYYANYNLVDESNNNILTEDNIQLISEQFNKNDKIEINNELIYSIDIIKNGQLLQSLMKECDFTAKVDLKIGTVINSQLGLLVNGDYEYLDYGDYIIYSKEYNADTETYKYVCYDMMLYSMIKYTPLNITYPTTIKTFITAIANKMGLDFANKNDIFTNYNETILKELFANQNLTYRDILDKLSEITASNIIINDNNKLELGYPNVTNDTINESNLKDTNVSFGEQFGVINKVSIIDGDISYSKQNDASVETNGVTQINIEDNVFTLNGNTENICQAILNKLNGLYYSINDFTTTGVCYYDYLDLFNVEAKGNTYQCLLLNNEIHIAQGLTENIFTQIKENTQNEENKYEISTPNIKTVQFKINQQEGTLQSKVDKNGVISSINQSAEQIQINANKISLEGKEIDLTSDNIKIDSTNFKVTKDGNMTCTNATMNNANIVNGAINITQEQGQTTLPLILKQTASNSKTYQFSAGAGACELKNLTDDISYGRFSAGTRGYGYFYLADSNGTQRIIEDGNVGNITINNSSNNAIVQIAHNNQNGLIQMYDSSGNMPIALTASSGNIKCVTLTQTSKEENKKNFEKLNNALDIIKNIDIYKYNFKFEEDNDKKHIGFVIGKNYKYSKEVTSKENDGADIYNFVSVCCQAIKEQQAIIEDLQQRINKLEKENK